MRSVGRKSSQKRLGGAYSREEAVDVPWVEGGVPEAKHDVQQPDQGDPCTVWLEVSSVLELIPVDTLGLASAVEEDVGHTHDDVVDETWRMPF